MNDKLRLLMLFAAAAGCGVSDREESKIEQSSSPLYADRSKLWPVTADIPVCWETPFFSTERGWVREAVRRAWSEASSVRFLGWGFCAAGQPGLHVTVRDEVTPPHTEALGTDLDGMSNGVVLNFTFNNFSPSCQGAERRSCIETVAVHEFGHALGYLHEQDRADTPEWCDETPAMQGDWELGDWDLDSVMNYCNPIWGGGGALSATDTLGARMTYDLGYRTFSGTGAAVAIGNLDTDAALELAIAVEDEPAGTIVLRVYNLRLVGDHLETFTQIGSLTLSGTNPVIALGDTNGDGDQDVILGSRDSLGRGALMVYDPGNRAGTLDFSFERRIGDLRLTGSMLGVSAVRFDSAQTDVDIAMVMRDSAGQIALLIYDPVVLENNKLDLTSARRNGDLRFSGSDPSVARGNLDDDPADELILSYVDALGQTNVELYGPTRVVNRDLDLSRPEGRMDPITGTRPKVASGNYDGDAADELVVVSRDSSARTAVMVYNAVPAAAGSEWEWVLPSSQRIKDERIKPAELCHLAAGAVIAGRTPQVMLACEGGETGTELLMRQLH